MPKYVGGTLTMAVDYATSFSQKVFLICWNIVLMFDAFVEGIYKSFFDFQHKDGMLEKLDIHVEERVAEDQLFDNQKVPYFHSLILK